MSIVDAIQKAKELARQRAPEDAGQRSRSKAGASERPRYERPPMGDRELETTAPQIAVEPVRFDTFIPYDAAVCAHNHIAVPNGEGGFGNFAAAPYRMIRTLLLQRCRANGWWNVAITSPGPGEGKSVTALNLAISLAREGNYDIFLIDLDMRAPSMCRYLGLAPKTDVIGYFEGKCEPGDVFFNVGIERLTLAGNARATEHSSELLANGRLEELLAFIRRSSSNPLVILDLPPVINTDDAITVAPKIDATALIVSQGRTKRDSLQRAVGLLQQYTLMGVILNRSHESLGGDYYGEYGANR